jgi:hypothetical protein
VLLNSYVFEILKKPKKILASYHDYRKKNLEGEMTTLKLPIVSVNPCLSLLYTSIIEVEAPLEVGKTAYGERRIINISGGVFEGPRLSGKILPGGADWQFIRNDGATELEAKYTLKTKDGALIYVTNWGLRHGPPETMRRLAAGHDVDPKDYYFRTNPRFETGSSQYHWLNKLLAIASGERRAFKVIITVYEVK